MLHLAMKFWNLDADQALFRIAAEVPEICSRRFKPDDLLEYKQQYARLDRAETFWQKCRQDLPRSAGMRQLRMHMDMATSLGYEVWKQRGGQFVGSATKDEINAMTGVTRNLFSGHDFSNVEHRRFLADEECLVMPFSDLPGRISSFLIYRLNKEGTGGVPAAYYSPLLPLGHLPQRRRLAPGVSMLETLLDRPVTSGPVLVLDDPLVAVRLQVLHLRHKKTPLAIGAVWPAAPVANILATHVPELVFWTSKPDLDIFRHARAANARISVNTATMQEVHGQIKRSGPEEWVKIRLRRSLPWEQILEYHLMGISLPEAESILVRMNLNAEELNKFISGCPRRLQDRLAPFLKSISRRVVAVGDGKFYETEEGWFNYRTGQQLTDVILRVERTFYRAREQQIYHEGKVLYQGDEIPFMASNDDINNHNTAQWLKRFLISHGYTVPTICGNNGDASLFDIATAFHKPQTVQAVEGYGWDENGAQFCFPDFVIKADGNVTTSSVLTFYDYEDAMADLEPPRDLAAGEIEVLNESPWSWAVASCVLHNLLAPYFRWKKAGTAVVGEVFQTIRAIARSLGCPFYVRSSNCSTAYLTRRELAGGWPLCFEGLEFRSPPLVEWIRTPEHNCMAKMGWHAARAACTNGGWFLLEEETVNLRDGQLAATHAIIPAFLKWLLSRRPARRHTGTGLDTVGGFLAEWYDSIGGTAEAVLEGHRLVRGEDRVQGFIDILCCLYEEGHISLRPESYSGKEAPTMVYNDQGHLWISKTGINQSLGKVWMPGLNTLSLTAALADQNVLLFEKEFQDRPGWVIRMDQWEKWLRHWRSQRRKHFRLIG